MHTLIVVKKPLSSNRMHFATHSFSLSMSQGNNIENNQIFNVGVVVDDVVLINVIAIIVVVANVAVAVAVAV